MQTLTKTAKAEKKEGVKKAAPKTEKSTTKINDVLNPTAEGRIKKLENFRLLADKHHFLTDKKDELEKFMVSADGTRDEIVLSNSQGFRLKVSNSQVVEEVVQLISEKLDVFLKASEKEILKYSI